MAENSMEKKTAAQKRTALLALAAEHGGKAGDCLTPEAMAAFLDGTCSREEKDFALKHISLCQRCYGEWMVLIDLQFESHRMRRTRESRPFFLRPANLAAFAAAMAAMVSIGLFLDINPFSYRIDSEPAPPAATRQEKSATSSVAEDRAAEQAAPPASARQEVQSVPPRENRVSEDRADRSEALEQDAAGQPSTRLKSAAPPRPAEVGEKAGPAAPQESREQAEIQRQAPPALSFRQWQQELTAVCRGKEGRAVDGTRLRNLYDEGKKALPAWQQESPATSAEQSLRDLILPLLEQAGDEGQLFEHCPEILAARDGTPNQPE